MSPRLLLAFLNYNTAEELREALLSLPAAREGVDCDVVIIDNASPKPGETEKLEALKGDARLVRTEENLGFAGAFNKVLPKKGDDPASFPYDYVLLLNSDLILPPGFLRDLVEALRNLPALGLAGISFTREDGSPQFSYGPTPTLTSELINRSLFQKRYRKTHASPDGRPIEVESVLGAVMAVNCSAVCQAGPMDERFFFFFEETEWCCRMRDNGFKVWHVPGVKATHLQGRSANKRPLRSRVEFHRSRRLFFKLRYGSFALAVLTAGTFLRLIINLLAQLVMVVLTLGLKRKFRDKAYLYAGLLKWYLQGCPPGAGLDARACRK